jgi:hypothetical protein
MKRYLLIMAMLLGAVSSWGQNLSKDFVVIDKSCPDSPQLTAQYKGQTNLLVLALTTVMPPNQIATALAGTNVTDLHIFVMGKPGSMVFGNLALNSANIGEYAAPLGTWAARISGKVVIHNDDVFLGTEGLQLKAKFEQLTGLTIIVQ